MAKQDTYRIGPGLRDKLREVVRKVDALSVKTHGPGSRPIHQEMPRGSGSRGGTKVGKTTGVWEKNSYAQITVYDQGDPLSPTTKDPPEVIQFCVNKFATVGADKWVAISKATNGHWYLVSAEC